MFTRKVISSSNKTLYLQFLFVLLANGIELGMFLNTDSFYTSADSSCLFKNTPKFYHIDISV